jgi:hypothetical protein
MLFYDEEPSCCGSCGLGKPKQTIPTAEQLIEAIIKNTGVTIQGQRYHPEWVVNLLGPIGLLPGMGRNADDNF